MGSLPGRCKFAILTKTIIAGLGTWGEAIRERQDPFRTNAKWPNWEIGKSELIPVH